MPQNVQPLVTAGPFTGVDNTTADIWTDPTKAVSMSNGDCEVVPKALVAKAGRQNFATVTGSIFGGLLNVYLVALGELGYTANQVNDIIFISGVPPTSGTTPNTNVARGFLLNDGSTFLPAGLLTTQAYLPWTQAVTQSGAYNSGQFQPPAVTVYDDYGMQTPVLGSAGELNSFQWHYYPPNVTYFGLPGLAASTTGGSITADTYQYAYTFVAQPPGYNGSQETSPYLPTTTVTTTGTTSSITITVPAFSGTFPYDSNVNYTTNIYRYSAGQPVYYLVASGVTGTTYVDTYSNTTISSRAQLVFNRDPAPNKSSADFGPNVAGVVATNYYVGAPIWAHQGRMFVFAVVNNLDTGFQFQAQLWFSNFNRPWEFDKVNNTLLVELPDSGDNITPGGTFITPNQFINPYLYPVNVYTDVPSAGVSLASVSLFWTTKRMYVLFGNSASTYIFQKFADIGCTSRKSVAYASTETAVGVFWMSENGIYFTNGSGTQYISEQIRSYINQLSVQDRYTCVGFYADHTYYISFPVSGQTWAYRTTTNQWHGPMPYATDSASVQVSDPRILNQALALPGQLNQIMAHRMGTNSVDNWLAQTDTDLSAPTTVTYTSPAQVSGQPHIEKEYTHIGITFNKPTAPIVVTVTLTVDQDPTRTFVNTFNCGGANAGENDNTQICTISESQNGNAMRGFMCTMTISWTGNVANTNTPFQLKNVVVYGVLGSRVLTPTVGLYQ